MFSSVVILGGEIVRIGARTAEDPREAGQRNGPTILWQGVLAERHADFGQVDVLLIRPPGLSSLRQKSAEVLGSFLAIGWSVLKGIVVVQNLEIAAGFCPDV